MTPSRAFSIPPARQRRADARQLRLAGFPIRKAWLPFCRSAAIGHSPDARKGQRPARPRRKAFIEGANQGGGKHQEDDEMAKPRADGPGRGLTAKQARFVEEYLTSLNATEAARKAGYSEKQAGKIGHENLQKPAIAAAIEAAMAERSERVQIDADWVLRRLADEVDADLADILSDDGAIRPVKDWPKIWRQGLVAGIDVQEDTVEGVKVGQTVKIRLSDRIKRIELIGKHVGVGAFRERVDVSNHDGSLAPRIIDASKLSTEALRELAGVLNGKSAETDGG